MLTELEKYPLQTYEVYLLNHLTKIYSARKEVIRTDWTKHSDLLIDKFAIHSSTLFQLIDGIIEHKSVDPNVRKFSFDLFSVNSLLRVLIETYITFNHIFVLGKSEDEKEFRFLLWQLDGLLEQKKFKINNDDFEEVESILNANKTKIDSLFDQITATAFYKTITKTELVKIFDTDKRKTNWKFKITEDNRIIPLKIIELVELTCVSRTFINLYKYTSTHTHSGYVSIEHFEKMRGKQVSDDYVNPLVNQANILTIFLIKDICSIDTNAQKAFLNLSDNTRHEIIGINKAFRKI
ncbi:MAG: hypothetical protein HY062_04840 [Bacteroidetes bacterium]|nr:hypothetical protein [Bacteroidota bacterium]